MAIPSYATRGERIWHWVFCVLCALIFLFLIGPILVIIPLSFNAEPYFTFSEKMRALGEEFLATHADPQAEAGDLLERRDIV